MLGRHKRKIITFVISRNKEMRFPATYELGIRNKNTGEIQKVYVGKTDNLHRRISEYRRDGSHISEEIEDYRERGYDIYFRFERMKTVEDARDREKRLLDKGGKADYRWNDKEAY